MDNTIGAKGVTTALAGLTGALTSISTRLETTATDAPELLNDLDLAAVQTAVSAMRAALDSIIDTTAPATA